MKIATVDDLIAVRFLLCMSIEELAANLGVSQALIDRVEGRVSPMPLSLGYALRALCETVSHAEYVKELYSTLDTEHFVQFLRSCGGKGNSVPRTQKYQCGCSRQELTLTWRNGRDRTHLDASCGYCGRVADMRSMAMFRYKMLVEDQKIDLYMRELYSISEWKSSRVRLERSVC